MAEKLKYNWAHQQTSQAPAPRWPSARPCIYCGGAMLGSMKLDLDHTTGQITHAKCNRSAGAKYGNALRGLRRRYSTIYQEGGGNDER